MYAVAACRVLALSGVYREAGCNTACSPKMLAQSHKSLEERYCDA